MKIKKYTLEVTKEQLKSIANACELSSRLRQGEFSELHSIFQDLENTKIIKLEESIKEEKINDLKRLFGLLPGECLGVMGSSLESRRLYEIYFSIKHIFAEGISVYKYNLLKVTDEPVINIKEEEFELTTENN